MPASTRRAFLTGVAAAVLPLPAGATSPMKPRTIEARAGKAVIGTGGETDILGFDGATPGPVLRYWQGQELTVQLVNKLDLPVSIHWHGMRGENAMDGVAPLTQSAVAPGASFDYRRHAPGAGPLLLPPQRLWKDAGADGPGPQGPARRRRA